MTSLCFFPGFFVSAEAEHWVDRMEAGCAAIESMFEIRLDRATSGTKFHVTKKEIHDRRKFFASRLKTRNRWFSLFSGTGMRRTVTGWENVDYFCIGGSMYYGGQLYGISFTIPDQTVDTYEKLLLSLGDALHAQTAQFSPNAVAERLRLAHWCTVLSSAMRNTLADKSREEVTLPDICESTYAGLASFQPHHFGWLNYWSQEVCAYTGFPANADGLGILDCSYQTPTGAWIVKLGANPPQERDAGYVELLREMYVRFPRVGVRLTDAQPVAPADGPQNPWPAAELKR